MIKETAQARRKAIQPQPQCQPAVGSLPGPPSVLPGLLLLWEGSEDVAGHVPPSPSLNVSNRGVVFDYFMFRFPVLFLASCASCRDWKILSTVVLKGARGC